MMRSRDAVPEGIVLADPRAMSLHPRLVFARLAWVLVVSVAVGLFLVATPALYRQRGAPSEAVREGLVRLGLSAGYYAAYYVAVLGIFALVCLVVAVLIARRKPDGMALFTSLLLAGLGTTNHPNMQALVARHPALVLPATLAVSFLYASVIVFLFVFPDGRLSPS